MLKLISFVMLFVFSSWSCVKEAIPDTGADNGATNPDASSNSFNVNSSTLLQLVNNIRAKGCNCAGTYMPAVAPVSWNNQLAQAAYNHSKDMNSKKYFSHTSPSGSNPGDRIRAAGYSWTAYGENIAFNYPNEQAVVDGWLKSVNHCKTIMNPNYKEMGVGREGAYWTQDFGAK